MEHAKILVVDDEINITQVIKAYLEKSNYIVYEADSGSSALQLFESLEPDLIVLDLKHPKRVFSRFELVNLIQGDAFEGFERTIDVHVKNLRQKIGDDPKHPKFISTVFGVGYKFQVNPDD